SLSPTPRLLNSPLFPYTTLFRSEVGALTQTPTIVAVLTHRLGLDQLAGLLIAATQILGSDEPKLSRINNPGVRVHTTRQIRCRRDRKSTRLNSSHVSISYAVFCL